MTGRLEFQRAGPALAARSNEAAVQKPPIRSAPRTISQHASMRLLQGLLRKIIHKGRLILIAPDELAIEFGSAGERVAIRITDWAVVHRLALDPDLAIGEAYMAGTLVMENGSIYDFLELCLNNLGWGRGHWLRHAHAIIGRLGRRLAQHNPVRVARVNAAHHYDLSDALYGHFLDSDRQYSCAYYMSPEDTLEAAQAQKKRHLAAKLLLRAGQRVLDIGSGWGGLAIHLAEAAAVNVTGITLSTEQHKYSSQRAAQVGLTGRVNFLLKDYRHEAGRYDRIVSVGMFEHVGVGHYREFFKKLRELLTDDGIALIHTIGSAAGSGGTHAWLHKYIFPGGYTPALSEVVPVIEQAGLHITDVEVLRMHYAETLKAWRQRFMASREHIVELYDERFCRMWEFYLAGCEAAFRHSGLVVYQIQVSKRNDNVPLTRDYIAEWERSHSGQLAAG